MGTLPGGKADGVIVVAEDHDDTRELHAQTFGEAGFTVHAVADGAQAVALATENVHAYVIDLQMPVMDGWEAIGRIREAVGQKPYILAVSAHISASDTRREIYEVGADDVVAKPIDANVLVTIVRAALRERPH